MSFIMKPLRRLSLRPWRTPQSRRNSMDQPQVYAHSSKNVQLSAPNSSDEDAMLVYLVSDPIPDGVEVGSVKFTIRSHDQGWGGDRGLSAPYEGSWTWFSAVAISESEAKSIRNPAKVRDLCTRAVLVQRNKRADSTKLTHVVSWKRGKTQLHNVDEDGKGDGHGFVESLEPRNKIALIAFARHSGWTNYVHEASIEIEYSTPEAAPPQNPAPQQAPDTQNSPQGDTLTRELSPI
ncbi:hypothetical protein AX16_005870 [Volvariella volvacea WC 439]|nr:hypothetical protein AX16_005870 [Volvariella volvacea WC 439]